MKRERERGGEGGREGKREGGRAYLGLVDDGVAEVVVRHAHGLHVGDEGGGIEGGRLGVHRCTADAEADGCFFLREGGREGGREGRRVSDMEGGTEEGRREGGTGGGREGTCLKVEQHVQEGEGVLAPAQA